MSKTSDWKIVATEGATVDGRKITSSWIKDMAEQYSIGEYTAMVWPEHSRSRWDVFHGNNWGVIEAVKAEKKDGKLRLFAKITPNHLLLNANKNGQKLFTSIEPEPDYKGQGRCYLMGIAVTDSPASTGTDRLKFSREKGETTEIECSELEEINLDECYSSSDRFFSMCKTFFQSGDSSPEPTPETEPEGTDVTEEQLKAALKETLGSQFSALKTELKEELTQEFAKSSTPEAAETPEQQSSEFSLEMFSTELAKQLKPLTDQVNGLEGQFIQLAGEQDGQRPGGEGAGETIEVV